MSHVRLYFRTQVSIAMQCDSSIQRQNNAIIEIHYQIPPDSGVQLIERDSHQYASICYMHLNWVQKAWSSGPQLRCM